jgi:hypothetical protein
MRCKKKNISRTCVFVELKQQEKNIFFIFVNYVENFKAQLAPYRTVSLLQFQNIRTGFVTKVSASVGKSRKLSHFGIH